MPRNGSYFTKEIAVCDASIIVVRGTDGELRAFHNICRHRGNKLVWTDFPDEEVQGTCRQFQCKYHGWRYGLDGALTFVQQEGEFFDLDKGDFPLVQVPLDVWEGFIFVNLQREPEESLREFLGDMAAGLEGYPFGELTQVYSYRAEVGSNWKLFIDAFQEFYHAPVLHLKQHMPRRRDPVDGARLRGHPLRGRRSAPHGVDVGRHDGARARRVGEAGRRAVPERAVRPVGQARPGRAAALAEPGGAPRLGARLVPVLAQLRAAVLGGGLVPHVPLLAVGGRPPPVRGAPLLQATAERARAARPGAGRGHVQGVRAPGRQHAGGDAEDAPVARVVTEFPLGDQEVLCRHLHKVAQDYVAAYGK